VVVRRLGCGRSRQSLLCHRALDLCIEQAVQVLEARSGFWPQLSLSVEVEDPNSKLEHLATALPVAKHTDEKD
jgi:hypothetical protein